MQLCPNCREENPDRFRLCGFCGQPLATTAPPREVRKTVTVVFCDLKGSTNLGEALDSESLRQVMTRYFEAMRTVLERHGGTIEKYIGDAVMAVFGLPTVHEDDALRAVRAAFEMTEALAVLNGELARTWGVTLSNRTGVNTGEVVAGEPAAGQRLVVGDAVNVAARLEQAAPADEVLIGEPTFRLVRNAVDVEAVEPLDLKGKSEPVPAYRLIGVRAGEGFARRLDAPLVGRHRELEALRDAFEAAARTRTPRSVTVIGAAGVGKSRLIQEFLARVSGGATVLRGRCLNYGDGITFWPLAEVVRQAAGITDEDEVEVARARVAALLPGGERDVVERLEAAIGLTSQVFAVEEIAWAARKLVEAIARTGPLVVLFDDVHWAEVTMLDLVEHVVAEAEAQVLVLASARPDLLEHRPGWIEGERTSSIALAPLSAADSGHIVDNLLGGAGLPPALRERIVAAAEGNPLFVEQMLSMLVADGLLAAGADGAWTPTGDPDQLPVPATISALLSARLDRLVGGERELLERGAVVGSVFQRGAVTALSPEPARDGVPVALLDLERKQFIRPDEASLLGEDAFRFEHILIRDAAYGALLKRARAELHEAYAGWLVEAAGSRELEVEEIVGYHLEQAYRYRAELGPLDDHSREVGARACARLGAAGRRAYARGDMPAAAHLLGRAVSVVEADDPVRLDLLPEYAEALSNTGAFERAEALCEELAAASRRLGDPIRETNATLVLLFIHYTRDPAGWREEVLRETAAAAPVLEAAGDHAGLVRVYRLLGWVYGTACQYGRAEVPVRQAITHARLGGDRRAETRNLMSLALSAAYGPTPVEEAIPRVTRIVQDVEGDQRAEGVALCALSHLLAMRGAFGEARTHYRRARAILSDLGGTVLAATVSMDSSRVELLAGRPDLAEAELRPDFDTLQAIGERYALSSTAALLGISVYLQDRLDEALELARVSEEATAEDDIESQALFRRLRARVLARRGEVDAGERLAREAVALAGGTDAPILQAHSLMDLAEVLIEGNDPNRAVELVRGARERFDRKGDVVSAGRARGTLERLGAGAGAAVPPGRP